MYLQTVTCLHQEFYSRNKLLGNTDTVKKIITWSSQFSENFLEVGDIFLSVSTVYISQTHSFSFLFTSFIVDMFGKKVSQLTSYFVVLYLSSLGPSRHSISKHFAILS